MPTIRPSAYLRNNYNEISELCHSRMEYELYHLLDEALEAEKSGDFMDYDDFMICLKREVLTMKEFPEISPALLRHDTPGNCSRY